MAAPPPHTVRVFRLGRSIAIVLPRQLARFAGITVGTILEVTDVSAAGGISFRRRLLGPPQRVDFVSDGKGGKDVR